jgi:hypothetical protein
MEAAAEKRTANPGWRAIAFLIACATLLGYWYFSSLPMAFDRELWLRSEPAQDSPRLSMADGLVESRALVGKGRAEIEAMLGKPRETKYFTEYDLVYLLGPERGFLAIDSEWLVIKLNGDGRAGEVRIVRD